MLNWLVQADPRVRLRLFRALNGVEKAVFYHGEEVATRRRYDSRLLLAHLARLDRQAEREEAQALAGQFDDALEKLEAGERVVPAPAATGGDDPAEEELPPVEAALRWLEAQGAFDGDEPWDDAPLDGEPLDDGEAAETAGGNSPP